MTTAYRSSGFSSIDRKYNVEEKKLSLFSPFTLLVLLAMVFIFFMTSSGETGYTREASEVKTAVKNELRPDSELMYKNIVTKGDAIRSVLQ